MSNQTAAARALTPAEQKAMDAWSERKKRSSPRIKIHGKEGETTAIGTDHPDGMAGFALLMEATGANDEPFLAGLMTQLVNAATEGQEVNEAAEANANFLLSVVKGIEPRDQMEAMLAAQMATVHSATMEYARRLGNAGNQDQRDSAERAFNKLARTFTTQLEALKRYRSKGDQTVRVEHVTVNEGGQAIVGSIATGEGRGGKKNGL